MNFDTGFASLTISETRRRSPQGTKSESVMKLLRDDERFTTLVKHLEKSSDLSDDLDSSMNITFFAPTNQAFENYEKFMSGVETSGFEKERDMNEIIRYHISRESTVCFEDMHEGQLLTSSLKEKRLDNNYQKIRVTKVLGNIILNYMVVIMEADLETENGVVHVLGDVMCPPKSMLEQIYKVPFAFSTFVSAMQCCSSLHEKLNEDKSITCLVPINAAWKEMHMLDLIYLFSAAGAKDLKKVLEYHMCKDLVYAHDVMKEEKVELETYCKGEKLVIQATERRMEESSGKHNPQRWVLCVNQGESTIKRTDFLARNGNVQMISTVLIPDCVCLPSMRDSKESEERGHNRRKRDDDAEERRRRRRDRDGRRRLQ